MSAVVEGGQVAALYVAKVRECRRWGLELELRWKNAQPAAKVRVFGSSFRATRSMR